LRFWFVAVGNSDRVVTSSMHTYQVGLGTRRIYTENPMLARFATWQAGLLRLGRSRGLLQLRSWPRLEERCYRYTREFLHSCVSYSSVQYHCRVLGARILNLRARVVVSGRTEPA
jgi:hypothetical protein